ncbi:Ethanolamine_kinase [Hexamita inflata]|uniref:Putative n=1 Tax=Hexamita inflata TaxID=28002 RepID=A0ABP1GEK4_9EUKA
MNLEQVAEIMSYFQANPIFISQLSPTSQLISVNEVQYVLRQLNTRVLNTDERVVLQQLIAHNCTVGPQVFIQFSSFHLVQHIGGYTLFNDSDLIAHPEVLQTLKTLHQVPIIGINNNWHEHLINYIIQNLELNSAQLSKIQALKQLKLSKYCKICICHCDAHAGNIIFRENQPPALIDFEYSCEYYNYYDIACYIAEFCGIDFDVSFYPNDKQKLNILDTYLEQKIQESELEILKQFEILCMGVWGIWGKEMGWTAYAEGRIKMFYNLLE